MGLQNESRAVSLDKTFRKGVGRRTLRHDAAWTLRALPRPAPRLRQSDRDAIDHLGVRHVPVVRQRCLPRHQSARIDVSVFGDRRGVRFVQLTERVRDDIVTVEEVQPDPLEVGVVGSKAVDGTVSGRPKSS